VVDVIAANEELFGQYLVSTHLRTDHGPQFIAHALQECCTANSSGTAYTPPPWLPLADAVVEVDSGISC